MSVRRGVLSCRNALVITLADPSLGLFPAKRDDGDLDERPDRNDVSVRCSAHLPADAPLSPHSRSAVVIPCTLSSASAEHPQPVPDPHLRPNDNRPVSRSRIRGWGKQGPPPIRDDDAKEGLPVVACCITKKRTNTHTLVLSGPLRHLARAPQRGKWEVGTVP